MDLPNGSYFCCLALTGPRLGVEQEYGLPFGLTVSHAQNAIELEPHWVEWLGTIQANSFRKSSLFITATIDDRGGETAGLPAPELLDRRVRMFHQALVLLGCGYNKEALMVGGNKHRGGGVHLGPIRPTLTPCFLPYYRKLKKIETSDLEQAAAILANLELIYRHVQGRLYRRLRKGFNVWMRGTQEGEEWTERLHSFIRATEAALKPTIARQRSEKARKKSKVATKRWRDITPTFVERGQSIIGHSAKSAKLLRELYDVRSSIEHIKDVMPQLRTARDIDPKEAFGFRALQAEIIASTIYSRILGSPPLLEAFSTESKVEGFWKQGGYKRQSMWGGPIYIEAEARQSFLSHKPSAFY